MVKIFIFGSSGKMGKAVIRATEESDFSVTTGGFDLNLSSSIVATYNNINDVPNDFDVIIDFSRPALLGDIINLSKKYKKPVVIATTGYTELEEEKIKALSTEVAVLKSGNMSLGVNLLLMLAEQATKVLGSTFDIEITEKHHNQKVDAPSGTANMIADKIKSVKTDGKIVYGREGESLRDKNEIGMHSLRGGTIVGEHEVMFAGTNEIIKISHTALSREIFANGALKAAEFLKDKKSGYYTMADALKG